VKTLPSNITDNYLKTGNRPRFFVHVAGSERKWATVAANNYTDRVRGVQSITDEIDPFGGMGTVSAANVDVLRLGEDIQFYTSDSEFPRYQQPGSDIGAGRVSYYGSIYSIVRGSGAGVLAQFTGVRVGQAKASTTYYIHRGFLQFDIPSGVTSCEEAYIKLNGKADASDTDFYIYLVLGTWATNNIGIDSYDEFSGWASGTNDYTGTILNESFHTGTHFSLTDTNYIRLNRAGRQAVVNATGSVLKFMVLSNRDYDYDASHVPTGYEFVDFDLSVDNNTPTLELIYNTVKPDNQRARIYLAYDDPREDYGIPSSMSQTLNVWSGTVDDWALNSKLLSLSMRHNDFKRNVKLGKNVMTVADFSNIPEENVGRYIPITYGAPMSDAMVGDHANAIGREVNDVGTVDTNSGLRSYFKFPIIDTGTLDLARPTKAVLGLDGVLKTTHIGYPACWNDSLKSFARIWSDDLDDQTLGDYGIIEVKAGSPRVKDSRTDSSTPDYETFHGIGTSIIPGSIWMQSQVLNPDHAYSNTGYASVIDNSGVIFSFPECGSSGDIDKIELVFYFYDDYVLDSMELQVDLIDRTMVKPASGTLGYLPAGAGSGRSYFNDDSGDFSDVLVGDVIYCRIPGAFTAHHIVRDLVSSTSVKVGLITNGIDLVPILHLDHDLVYDIYRPSAYLHTFSGITADGDSTVIHIDITPYFSSWDAQNLLVGIAGTGGLGAARISLVQLRYYSNPGEKLTDVYLGKSGRIDDISGTITGVAISLIENPAHIIESLIVNDSGIPTTEIAAASFDAAATALSGWKFAFQLNEETGIENVFNYNGETGIVDNIAQQCNAIVLEDYTGKLKMKVFDPTGNFPTSGATLPNDLDIFEYSGSPSDGSLTRHPMYAFALNRINIDDTYNDFILKYNQNYATMKYESVLTIGNGVGVSADVSTNITASYLSVYDPPVHTTATALTQLKDLTSACYNDINTTNTFTFEAWAIRDTATATKLLQRLVRWYARRRYSVTLTTGLNAVGFELGDFINIRTDDIEGQFGTAFMECKKWKITKISTDLVGCKVTIDAIEAEIY
jgi:hypothetical protein